MTSSRGQAFRVGVGAVILLVGGGYAATILLGDDATSTVTATAHHGAHGVIGDGRTTAAGDYQLAGLRLDDGRLSFRVLGKDGAPVDRYAVVHDKRLHMFVFGTDLNDFRHVHPSQRGDNWVLGVDGLQPGRHRVVAEFTPQGTEESVMLGGTVSVAGQNLGNPLPPPSTTTEVDGYTVSVDGDLVLGQPSDLEVTVTDESGEPAVFEPFLDSWAHAALIHAATLAVAHLHPGEEYTDGAASPDRLTLGTPAAVMGEHRLIVEFATDSGVHQAEFTLPTP